MAVELDHEDRGSRNRQACSHVEPPERILIRSRPVRSSCVKRSDTASRLAGSARITTRSAGPRSSRRFRAACRRRRDTRCRSTAFPTALDTIRPIRGPGSPVSSERAYITRSGCPALVPRLTVISNSVERVIRYCAGSTASNLVPYHAVSERRPLRRRSATMARPARVRIRSRNPCTLARRRLLGWKVRLPLATAVTPCCVWPP